MWLVLGSDATCNTQRCEPDAFALHPEIWIDLKHMDHMDILRNIVKHPAFQGVRLEPPQKWMGGQRCWMHNQVRDIAKGFRQKTIDDVLPKNGAILCQSFALWIMKDLRSLTAIGQILSQMDWRFLCIFYCRCRCHFNFKVTTPILTLTPTERRFGSAVLFDLIATWYQAIQAGFCWQLARSLFHAPQDDRFSNTCGNVALCSMCKHKFKLQRRVISKGKCLLVATQRNASRCIQNSRQAQAVWCLCDSHFLWF